MPSLAHYRHLIQDLRRGVQAQKASTASLVRAFQSESVRLSRLDQARQLDDLRALIERDVARIEREESIAAYAFSEVGLLSGLAMLGIGGLHSLASRDSRPFSFWRGLAEHTFERPQPFGNVVVAIGSGGVPEDVSVVPLSRLAREQGIAEVLVSAHLQSQGHRLMTPHAFINYIDALRDRLPTGAQTLPVGESEPVLKPIARRRLHIISPPKGE